METDQRILDAQERLIRLREEEKTSPQEDLGYQKNINPKILQLFPRKSVKETLHASRSLPADRVKVTYISGIACGLTHILRTDIADDLIERGYAREVL
jgi:hypothetical protein